MLSHGFLRSAQRRIADPRDCTEADLRRATSDIYYSLFHRVCEALVGSIGSDPDNPAFVETYQTLYRLPDHSTLEKKCKIVLSQEFDQPVKRFAQLLITLKNKRHDADYDPLAKFALSEVRHDVAQAQSVLGAFNEIDGLQQARFAYFVSLDGKRTR